MLESGTGSPVNIDTDQALLLPTVDNKPINASILRACYETFRTDLAAHYEAFLTDYWEPMQVPFRPLYYSPSAGITLAIILAAGKVTQSAGQDLFGLLEMAVKYPQLTLGIIITLTIINAIVRVLPEALVFSLLVQYLMFV